ncbi:MAG: hypothetical protein GY765_05735 [bacterium]|nr:hypothetical protein [bacterium]
MSLVVGVLLLAIGSPIVGDREPALVVGELVTEKGNRQEKPARLTARNRVFPRNHKQPRYPGVGCSATQGGCP